MNELGRLNEGIKMNKHDEIENTEKSYVKK